MICSHFEMSIDYMNWNKDISLSLIFYLMLYFVLIKNRNAYLSILLCQLINIYKLRNMEWYIINLTELQLLSLTQYCNGLKIMTKAHSTGSWFQKGLCSQIAWLIGYSWAVFGKLSHCKLYKSEFSLSINESNN